MFGVKYALQNLNIYFSSIFYKNNYNISPRDIYYLTLFIDSLFYFFLIIGVKLGNNISIHLYIFISLFIQYISFGILYYFYEYFYIFLISIGLLNIGNALINLTIIKNCWQYFPKSFGFINGFLLSGTGLCSSLLTYLGEYIYINPEQKKINTNEELKNFFENEDNFKFFLLISGGILVICGIVGFIFNCEFKEEHSKDELLDSDCGEEEENDSLSNFNLNKRGSLTKKKKVKITINNALCSCQNIRLLFIGFFGLCKINKLINIK
jgi:hypothetical protein